MKENHCWCLHDPVNRAKFKGLRVFKKNGKEIIDGLLFNDRRWYPIISGIPRLLTDELRADLLRNHYDFYRRYLNKLPKKVKFEWGNETKKIDHLDKFLKHQKKTGESFAFEWKNIYRENDYEKKNFLHFLNPFLKEKDFVGKITLDVGCGSGRFTKWAAKFEARLAIGIDLGDSVEAAYKLTKNLKNVCIVQADIYNLPFADIFDIVYSIGVLHHLPEPKEGFLELPQVLKKGGKMLIWIYSRRNNSRALYFYEPIRSITNKMNKRLLFKLCYLPALIVHLVNYLTLGLNRIGAKKLAKKIPFFYYANFPFNMKLNDAFDVLATPKSNYYYSEEIKNWFEEAKLRKIGVFEHREAGITGIGEK